ncbi:hypothetical protein BK131_19000 [Paenibacillus amylolyticus]|uniref:Rad50/SbcC-type AAA domain-containing protein n=1 Tax=Paenibacillus amylolyticus TaxID=1451 RepID=A0A1R1BQM3_PAEAM|nr:ATP-binding protein [Paenibacillus amylolyticus]OMF12097.1 hypothetical protein BK131_19000 [Paenibacillus amylolyticus]
MSRLIIRKLHIDEHNSINFNDRVNYIIGSNGSGKTTLFHLIQYILGLKIKANRLTFLKTIDKPYLICEFKNKKVKISRALNSNIITFEGDITREVKAYSPELNELYTELLDISFINSYENNPSLDILDFSFYSDLDFRKNNGKDEVYTKILGYNSEYLDAIKRDILKFQKEIHIENQSLKLAEQYKQAVNKSLEKLNNDNSVGLFSNILDSEFEKIKYQVLTNYELLENAQNAYRQEQKMSEAFIAEKLSAIEPFFNDILKNINFRLQKSPRFSLESMTNQREFSRMSFGEKSLLLFSLRLTFCREYIELTNGLGLLVTDDIFTVNDFDTENMIHEKIIDISKAGEIQYIGFTSRANDISREHIVFDISPWQGVRLFER